MATEDIPDAIASQQAIYDQSNGATDTSSATIDPSIPSATPQPTSTPRLTSTPWPPLTPALPAPPLTKSLPNPHQAGVQYFPPTGHSLRGVFLDYWTKHAGVTKFGNPITEEFMEANSPNDKLLKVQYFEQARLEQHPEHAGTADEVRMVNGGTQLAQQKGYFAGSYPRYGYAVDFVWVSGKMLKYLPNDCLGIDCGCALLEYDPSINPFQLQGRSLDLYAKHYFTNDNNLPAIVIFGHRAGAGEAHSRCVDATDNLVYIVDDVRPNILPQIGDAMPASLCPATTGILSMSAPWHYGLKKACPADNGLSRHT